MVKPFDRFLQKRLGSFDQFIERLENISSIIFAFTFLIVFMVIALGLFVGVMGLLSLFFEKAEQLFLPEQTSKGIQIFILSVMVFSGLLYFLDFITIGFFKRKRWIAIWYFPIYRFFSFITLSWLYRPLYYNLIDTKFGRKVGLFLFPYFFTVLAVSTMKADVYLYIPDRDNGIRLESNFYDDERIEKARISVGTITSRFVKNGFLEVFIKNNPQQDNRVIEKICPDIRPDKSTGIRLTIISFSGGTPSDASPADSIMQCWEQMYRIYINDSLYQNPDYFTYIYPTFGEQGFKTILDVDGLSRGKHSLKVEKQRTLNSKPDSLFWSSMMEIPFWKE